MHLVHYFNMKYLNKYVLVLNPLLIDGLQTNKLNKKLEG